MVASDIGVKLAQYLSVKKKLISGDEDVTFLGEDKNGLFCIQRKLETKHYNYLIFWSPSFTNKKVSVGENAEYVNLGDWITIFYIWRF
jgi:UDP-2,3-diacylglucosamine hydrolase